MFEDYQSPDWTGTDFSYMKRGWCRIKMFFAANIPLLRQSENRNECFRRGLKFHRSQGRRPHLLFGTREKDDLKSGPQILPPLQNVYFARYHPEEGKLSKESDREKIKELVDHLLPLMKNLEPIYEGETLDDEKKVPHGKGKRIAEDGSWYAGDWQNGLRHGFGTSQTSAGGMYVGEWVNDKRNGYGTYSNPAGHVYSENWSDDVLHGFGRYVYSNGEIYEGDWEEGRKNGHGKYFFANGDVYEGGFKLSKEHGYGKFIVGATQEVKYGIYEDGKLIKESTFPFMLP